MKTLKVCVAGVHIAHQKCSHTHFLVPFFSWHERITLARLNKTKLHLVINVWMHNKTIKFLFWFSGILSQRTFVMLPCGGVGVRENTHTFNERCTKRHDHWNNESWRGFKGKQQRQENYKKDRNKERILKWKRELARPALTFAWQSKSNHDSSD